MAQLIIRQEQMKVLEDEMLCRWIRDYLTACYPERASHFQPSPLIEFVRKRVLDARKRGFAAGQHLRKYAHVAFLLGGDFASAPDLPWARKILENPDYHDPGARLRALEDAAIQHLKQEPSRRAMAARA